MSYRTSSIFLMLLAWLSIVAGSAHAQNDAVVAWVDVPSTMVSGQSYLVRVAVQNVGATTWSASANYKLGSQNPADNTYWSPTARIELDPGETVAPYAYKVFSLNVIAPGTGVYPFRWRMVQEYVQWFGQLSPDYYVTVTAPAANSAVITGQPSVPNNTLYFHVPTQVSVTVKNTGTNTWTSAAGYALGSANPWNNGYWTIGRVPLAPGESIAPGQSKTFVFNVSANVPPGSYNFQWQMLQEYVEWFGPPTANIVVNVPAKNDASFVTQVVPSLVQGGRDYTVKVWMQNTGNTTWTGDGTYKYGLSAQNPQNNTYWSDPQAPSNRVYLPAGETVPPNGVKLFQWTVRAPLVAGSYPFQWQMVQEWIEYFGGYSANLNVQVWDLNSKISLMKSKGCMFASLLWDNPVHMSSRNGSAPTEFDEDVALLGRSDCEHLHRAVETWTYPPDWAEINYRKSVVTSRYPAKAPIYGMFIAEAIYKAPVESYRKRALNPATGNWDLIEPPQYFDWDAMCVDGSVGAWGAETCIPDFKKPEYQAFFLQLAREGVDNGIEDILVGQVYHIEGWGLGPPNTTPLAPGLVQQVREYAASKGKFVVIGAQTNHLTPAWYPILGSPVDYLKKFDYIIGGLGQSAAGTWELEGPDDMCANRYPSFCWGLLWHSTFAAYAKNVLIALDWSDMNDDVHLFGSMQTKGQRLGFLKSAYDFFLDPGRNMGFLMPFRAHLTPAPGNSCYGRSTAYFSASDWFASPGSGGVPMYCRGEQGHETGMRNIMNGLAP